MVKRIRGAVVEITSINNELVKETVKLQQKKYRDKENKFLLEGEKCVTEAINAGIKIDKIFVLQDKANKYKLINPILTTEQVLKKISTTESAPEIIAVGEKRKFSINDIKLSKKLILLENIKDMGNLGTILRTACAFKADGVILYGKECADIYNPKCVRASVGNLWKLPVVYIEDFNELKNNFSKYERIATLPRAKTYLKNFTAKEPMIVMFGSEADGLSEELINYSTNQVKIEMGEDVESLNLSVSCAVVLYKMFL